MLVNEKAVDMVARVSQRTIIRDLHSEAGDFRPSRSAGGSHEVACIVSCPRFGCRELILFKFKFIVVYESSLGARSEVSANLAIPLYGLQHMFVCA